MITKTFHAENMMQALQAIQAEMGPDALVLSMREIPVGSVWQVWKKPGVEVVASTGIPGVKKETKQIRYEIPDLEDKTPSEQARDEITAILAALGRTDQKQISANGSSKRSQGMNRVPVKNNQPKAWNPKILKREMGGFVDADELVEERFSSEDIKRSGSTDDTAIHTTPPLKERLLPTGLFLVRQQLLDQGVDSNLVERMMTVNNQTLSPSILESEKRLNHYLRKQFEVEIKGPKTPIYTLPGRVVCIVGASGSGKTSTCAKLASYYSTNMGKKVVWVEADTIRTGAIAEARAYTEALNIPMFLVYTPQELAEVVSAQKEADLILVDTAGCNPHDEDKVLELGTYLAQIPGRSIYLAAPATMKESDLYQAFTAFSPFQLKGLILTKMDETDTYGSVYNLAWHSKQPISFMTTGKDVMGHLKTGDPAELINAIFDGGMIR